MYNDLSSLNYTTNMTYSTLVMPYFVQVVIINQLKLKQLFSQIIIQKIFHFKYFVYSLVF